MNEEQLFMFSLLLLTILLFVLCFSVLIFSSYLMYSYAKEINRNFFPILSISNWKFRNLVLNIMLSPIYWFIQLGIIIGFSLMFFSFALETSPYSIEEMLLTFLSSSFVSLTSTLLYSLIIWIAEYKNNEPLKLFPTLFLWGSMAAIISFVFGILLDIFSYSTNIGNFGLLLSFLLIPIVEESSKSIGLVILSKYDHFKGILDGILYGFIIGMGFSFIEDWVYYYQYPPMELGLMNWFGLIFFRGIITGGAHGIFTAIVGVFLVLYKERKLFNKWVWLIAGLFVSISLHLLFNSITLVSGLVNIADNFSNIFIFGYMLIMIIVLFVVFKKGLDEQKRKKKRVKRI